MFISSLEKLQIGLETVWGDNTTPTVQPAGIQSVVLEPKVEATQLTDKSGDTMPSRQGMVTRLFSEANIGGVVTYEDFHYWLDAMFGKVTPAGNVYTYSGSMNWSSPHPAVHSFAMRYGQDGLIYSVSGMMMDRLDINGSTGAPAQFTSHFFGKTVGSGSFAGITFTSITPAMGSDVSLFIDAAGETIGTTPIETTAFSYSISVAPDRKPVWHLGSLQPDAYRHGKWGGSLKLTLEMTAAMKVILDAILANRVTPSGFLVRIKETGAGTKYEQIDFAGQLLSSPTLFTDLDGIVTVELNFTPFYDASLNSCWGAKVCKA